MIIISQEQLLNIINVTDISFLLGAGCSIASGCMGADTLVYEFKKRIYCNDTKKELSKFDYLSDDLKLLLNEYFKNVHVNNEYSYYFEKCFPTKNVRMQFIKNQFYTKPISLGYKCFAKILLNKHTKIVYTTNFDNLIERSIKALNPDYDVCKCNDKYIPLTSNELVITELHGDYNYSLPKNTSEELLELSENTKNAILSCSANVLIVIGYSGADKSVMSALKEFVDRNKTKSIIWCVYNKQINENVKNFMEYASTINEDSCICDFGGFDELCLNYYNQYLERDPKIDNDIIIKPKLEFSNTYLLNKKEILGSNLYKIIKFPQLYKIDNISSSKEIYERINECYVGQFNKQNLYFIGDINWLQNFFPNNEIKLIDFSNNFVMENKNICIKLLKDYISKSILNKDSHVKQYHRKLYFDDNKDKDNICDGFSVDINFINNETYLSFSKEFIYEGELTQSIKNKILNKFSSIKNKTFSDWLNNLIMKLGIKLDLWNTSLSYEINSLMLSNLEYSLLEEPKITTNDKEENISALHCISNSGIQHSLQKKDKIKIIIICPSVSRHDLAVYFKNLDREILSKYNIYPNYLGFLKMFDVKIEYQVSEFSLKDCENLTFIQYCNFLLNKMESEKRTNNPDLFVIYTPSQLEKFEYSEDNDKNLHDYIKLHSANKYITQFISQKSINSSDSLCKRIWNLAIAIYTKTIGLPWQPSSYMQENAYVGIGYGMNANGIVVGCSQLFDSKGRGLQLFLRPVSSSAKNPYMTEKESFDVGKNLCNMYYSYYPTKTLKNVTIHKSTFFTKDEISGLQKAFSHVENLELIQIENKPNIRAIKYFNKNKIDLFPLSRGTLIKINDNEALLWTHGRVCYTGFNNGDNYVKGGKASPSPVLIRRFIGNLPLEEIAKNILMLTKMDYNSADTLYSNMPVTIKYTDKVVDIIKQDVSSLSEVDFRFVI